MFVPKGTTWSRRRYGCEIRARGRNPASYHPGGRGFVSQTGSACDQSRPGNRGFEYGQGPVLSLFQEQGDAGARGAASPPGRDPDRGGSAEIRDRFVGGSGTVVYRPDRIAKEVPYDTRMSFRDDWQRSHGER